MVERFLISFLIGGAIKAVEDGARAKKAPICEIATLRNYRDASKFLSELDA